MASEVKIGAFVGTAAALTISLGFVPDHVEIVNETDGDATWQWFKGMTDGHALQEVAAGTKSKITANGVSEFAGDGSTPAGFTIGTALSESGKTFRYIATRVAEY